MQNDVKGELRYFGLSDWWVQQFTSVERDHIETVFQPMSLGGGSERPLTQGEISWSSGTATKVLSGLLGWFRKTEIDLTVGRKIAAKLAEVVEFEPAVLDRHFGYQALIEWNYRQRHRDPDALSAAISACERQIALSREAADAFRRDGFVGLPRHVGFNQLRIIRKKQGDLVGAEAIQERASREGWR
jgi:hypothetical protein